MYLLSPENEAEIAERARDIMREGGLVVYPTDTVYGLGADATNKGSVESVYRAKGRSPYNPLSIAVASLWEVGNLTAMDARVKGVLTRVLPGPYTVILESTERLPYVTHLGRIGVRIPDHSLTLKLCREFPITCTSANLSGRPSPRRVSEVTVPADMVIDAGPTPLGIPSTVIDLTHDRPRILRKGSGDMALLTCAIVESGLPSPEMKEDCR